MVVGITSIMKNLSDRRDKIIIWFNFGTTTVIRIVILIVRISFERVVNRIRRSTMYAVTAVLSFMYSGHCLPYLDFMPEITIISDSVILFILLVGGICIRICAKKINRSLEWKRRYEITTFLFVITYGIYLAVIGLINEIKREKFWPGYRGVLFYFECSHLAVYTILALICKFRVFSKKQ